jgi:hypothetical protein
VSATGSTLLVAAPFDDARGEDTGAIYLLDAGDGTLIHTVPNPFPSPQDEFGLALTTLGERIVAGAYKDDGPPGAEITDAGAVYVFPVSALTGRCGDGSLDFGEACDPALQPCCTDTCLVEGPGRVCGTPTRQCEGEPRCDGTSAVCPATGAPVGGRGCSNADLGPCALDGVCDGLNLDCPPVFREAGFECRAETSCALAATCTGDRGECPPSQPRNVCDPASDPCCTPDCQIEFKGVPCSDAAPTRPCEGTRVCDGVSPSCPPDGPPVVRGCSLDGPCAGPSICDGKRLDCPAAFLPPTEVCRPAESECTLPATCTGDRFDCPPAPPKAGGTPCSEDGEVCTVDVCDGQGTCQHANKCAAVHIAVDQKACTSEGCRKLSVRCELLDGRAGACTARAFVDPGDPAGTAQEEPAVDSQRFTQQVVNNAAVTVRKRKGQRRKTVPLKLNPVGRKLLRESTTLRLLVVVDVAPEGKAPSTLSKLVRLLRQRR